MSFFCNACGCTPQCKPKCQNIQYPKLETFFKPKPCVSTENELDYNNLLCVTTRRKSKVLASDTLGNTVGVVKTPLLLKSDMPNNQIGGQRFATYLKAFAYLYLSPEYEWNSSVLNLILKEGQKLFSESDAEEKRKNSDGEKPKLPEGLSLQAISTTYSSSEAKVGRVFRLLGNDFGIELSENFSFVETLPGSSGDHLALNVKMENLKKMLKEFFKKRNYCLVSVNGWYVLIWRVRQMYFVLDICGRRLDTFETDKENGVVVLVCLSTLNNVNHLIANLSGFGKTEVCSLREMKVVMMGGSDGSHQTPEYGERADEYIVVNSDYAYLKSALHLSLKTESPLRSRSALPVGVAALLTAKIDHPATWTEKVLNRIICYGVSVCRFCWEQCLRSTEPIDFDCFPNQFRLGQFLVSFVLQPAQFEGTWKCVPNYNQADLRQALESLFDKNNNNLLVQINQQIYAVWKKNNFIYLMDPYRHRVIPADGTEPRTASLRVFRTLDAFFDIFNLILLSSNRTSQFYIHTVQIKKIELLDRMDCIVVTEEAQADELEVKSLNEAICFVVDDVQCLEDLGGQSDDEEEDSLEEEEVPESESEPEVGEEEGEGGGVAEDIADIESSDDEGVDHRRSKAKNVGGGRKRKGSEKRKKNKRDMSERNKKSRTDSIKSDAADARSKDAKNNDKSYADTSIKIDEKRTDKDNIGFNLKGDAKNVESKNSELKNVDVKTGNTKISDVKNGDLKSENLKNVDSKYGDLKSGYFKNGDSKYGKTDAISKRGDESDKFYDYRSPAKQKLSIDEPREPKTNERKSVIRETKSDEDTDLDKQQKDCKPSGYPGHTCVAHDMAVVASESGCYDSLCKLLRSGFKCADRILAIAPYGNFVVFRCNLMCQKRYYLFDGCTCNVEKFRHLDLNCGTKGLLSFRNLHDTIRYMIDTRNIRVNLKESRKRMIDKICRNHCTSKATAGLSAFDICQ